MHTSLNELPPLFDDMTDEELTMMSNDSAVLVAQINNLREKQLHGGGLSDDEVREGIKLLNDLRMLRAGKAATFETRIPLEKLF